MLFENLKIVTIFQFCLASLATYRLVVLFARDAGPFGLFKKLRALKGIGPMVGCPYCISIWLSANIEAAFFVSGVRDILVVSIAIVFALSAVSLILDRTFTSDFQN